MIIKHYCSEGQNRLKPHQWSRKQALLAVYGQAGVQTQRCGLTSILASHRTYVNCTALVKQEVLGNDFHQIDNAASPRFHEICEQGILYTNVLLW